jgi:hypothetical protein
MKMRVTVRGEGTELRGYASMEALASLTSPPGEQPYMVTASPVDDNYNPFLITEPENPPTLELSTALISGIWNESADVGAFVAQMSMIHHAQASIIRHERYLREQAEAIIERVKVARANHPECPEHPEGDVVTCGWKRTVQEIDLALGES